MAFIEKKQDEYDEELEICADILMALVDNKFKTLTLKGKWNALSEQDKKILTLEARLNV